MGPAPTGVRCLPPARSVPDPRLAMIQADARRAPQSLRQAVKKEADAVGPSDDVNIIEVGQQQLVGLQTSLDFRKACSARQGSKGPASKGLPALPPQPEKWYGLCLQSHATRTQTQRRRTNGRTGPPGTARSASSVARRDTLSKALTPSTESTVASGSSATAEAKPWERVRPSPGGEGKLVRVARRLKNRATRRPKPRADTTSGGTSARASNWATFQNQSESTSLSSISRADSAVRPEGAAGRKRGP